VGEDAPSHPGLPAIGNILLEGLDFVADPIALLRSLHDVAAGARLFALVANAAYFGALSAFFSGNRLARAHPLVYDELQPLLKAGGWQMVAIDPLADPMIPQECKEAVRVPTSPLAFEISDQAMLDRGRIAAFVAIADRG
jgi:hypothetical protein